MDWPKTPKELLKARYQAFVKGDVDFIVESCHPQIRAKQDQKSIEAWSRNADWKGLAIEHEEADEDRAFIDFTVRFVESGENVEHKEKAEFRKKDDRWYYFDSKFSRPEPIRRDSEKVGRNDPCPCGSGKKYKKCCGI